MDWKEAIWEQPLVSLRTSTQTTSKTGIASSHTNNAYISEELRPRTPSSPLTNPQASLPQTFSGVVHYQIPKSTIPTNFEQPYLYPSSFELAALSAMSRHSSSQGNKTSAQYQLMSSESPADQARSMSQVSPGFIFVIFPLSSRVIFTPPSSFPFLCLSLRVSVFERVL